MFGRRDFLKMFVVGGFLSRLAGLPGIRALHLKRARHWKRI